jgi:hypothetical protein
METLTLQSVDSYATINIRIKVFKSQYQISDCKMPGKNWYY